MRLPEQPRLVYIAYPKDAAWAHPRRVIIVVRRIREPSRLRDRNVADHAAGESVQVATKPRR